MASLNKYSCAVNEKVTQMNGSLSICDGIVDGTCVVLKEDIIIYAGPIPLAPGGIGGALVHIEYGRFLKGSKASEKNASIDTHAARGK